MNYKEEDKALIEGAGYTYYVFTEEKARKIIAKEIKGVTNNEWRTLIQMLYPNKMVGSGLIDSVLIFTISQKTHRRVDPPLRAYRDLYDNRGKEGSLLNQIYNVLKKAGLEDVIHESWKEYCLEAKANGKDNTK